MEKSSKEPENRKWAALEELVDARDAIAMEVVREVFERLPYGHKFTLSDGSVGYLRKLAEPQLCANQDSHYFECPHFGVDVVIEGGKLDHVEITAFQTGSGLAVGPATSEERANANSAKAAEVGVAQAPDTATNWASSHASGTSRPSTSSTRRTRRQHGNGGGSPQR
jgi:hypothetical protein